jgi:NADP-dependent 3-hydroxy acid dehydrogenase YdfG
MNNNNKTSENKIQKVAIVTGSSSGIGKTTAIALARLCPFTNTIPYGIIMI